MLVNRGGDPERRAILELNHELRKERRPFATPDQSGHVAFSIHALDYWFFVDKYPELGASDPVIARRAWQRFLNTEEGAKYKINPHEGKRGAPFHRGVIIR